MALAHARPGSAVAHLRRAAARLRDPPRRVHPPRHTRTSHRRDRRRSHADFAELDRGLGGFAQSAHRAARRGPVVGRASAAIRRCDRRRLHPGQLRTRLAGTTPAASRCVLQPGAIDGVRHRFARATRCVGCCHEQRFACKRLGTHGSAHRYARPAKHCARQSWSATTSSSFCVRCCRRYCTS